MLLVATQKTFSQYVVEGLVEFRRSLGKETLPMLLIIDVHKTHEVLDLCRDHNIHVLLLPVHLTHILQPLDVAVFNIYKAAVRNRNTIHAVQWIDEVSGVADATRKRCITIGKSLVAYRQAVTPHNIRMAFYKTGVYPPNMYRFLHNVKGLREVPPDVQADAHFIAHNERQAQLDKALRVRRRIKITDGIRMHGTMQALG